MFLERFLKPKWQHPKPEVRKQALLKLSPQAPESSAILLRLAETDPDPDVRRSAIKRVSDLALLRRRAREDANAGVREVASARYRQLLAGGTDEADLGARLAEVAECGDEAVLNYVARRGREPELRLAALERVPSSSVLEDAAINDGTPKVRLAAVARLTEPEALERVMRHTRERDRKVWKLAREALDTIHRQAAEAAQARADRVALCEAMEALAQGPWRETGAAERMRLENRWNAVPLAADPALAERFAAAAAACVARAEEEARRQAERPAPAPAEPEPQVVAEEVAEPELVVEAPPAAAEAIEAPAPAPAPDRRRLDELETLLEELSAELSAGRLKESQRLLARAQKLAEELGEREAARAARRLKKFAHRVRELQDWRRFATLPKQEELCRRMEALVGADLPPPALAERIKQLQEEWKSTGGSGSAESQRLWERFRAAADQAFEPCRAYFDEQARLREANLARRIELRDQLAGFVERADWERLELGALEAIRAQARREWQQATPVERKAGAAVESSFEGLMQTLSDRIGAIYETNRQRKAALVKQAQALVEADLREATQRAKELQAQWKQAGAVGAAAERKLWREFRAACDAIFQRRDETRQRLDAQRQSALDHARTLVEQAAALPQAEDPAEAVRRWSQLHEEFQALADLPREEARALERRLREIRGQLDERTAALARARVEAAWAAAEERAARCERLESLALNAPAEARARLAELAQEWEALPQPPAEAAAALEQRWQRALTAADGEGFPADVLEANRLRRRELCVRIEILAGLESPPEDGKLRMDLQVQRLTQGMVQGQRESDSASRLRGEWLGVGPTGSADAELSERFRQALARLG